MTSEGKAPGMEQDEVSKSSDHHPNINRKGPVATWAIEHFSHWHVGQSGDLSSGVFIIMDGTQWRMVLKKTTLEPVLARQCLKGPARVKVGFQFSLLTDSKTAVFLTEPLIRTFSDRTEAGCGRGIDIEIFAKRETFLPGDTLTLQCHLWRELPKPLSEKCSTVGVKLGKMNSIMEHKLNVIPDRSSDSDSSVVTEIPKTSKSAPVPKSSATTLLIHYMPFEEDNNPDERLSTSIILQLTNSTMTRNRMVLLDARNGQPVVSSPVALHHFARERESWPFPWPIHRSLITNSMIKNGRIIVRYDVMMNNRNHRPFTCGSERSYSETKSRQFGSTLSTDMRRLLSSPDSCHGDMSVVSGDGVLVRAHRAILCARSLVFEAMMERDMSERQSGTVHIPDIGGTTLKQLLSFLYTGQLEGEQALDCDTLAQLYTAGDKYGVLALKKRCSVLLRGCVTADNACDVLEFADLHSDCAMRDPALSVLCSRAEKMLISEDWRGLAERKRRLVEEAAEEVRMKRRKKS